MFRIPLSLALALFAVAPTFADGKVGIAIPIPLPAPPTSFATALPYVRLVHQVLDVVTTRESPTTMEAKLTLSEARSEWVVHRIKADVWVERTSTNYLGQVGVKVTIPCHVEFGLDLGALRASQFRFDASRRLLVVDLPPVYLREPVPALKEMKIEPYYKGLRGVLLDAEKVRRLQEELVKEDYLPAAREAAHAELTVAQGKAREQVQAFLQGLFRHAGADVEIVVR